MVRVGINIHEYTHTHTHVHHTRTHACTRAHTPHTGGPYTQGYDGCTLSTVLAVLYLELPHYFLL